MFHVDLAGLASWSTDERLAGGHVMKLCLEYKKLEKVIKPENLISEDLNIYKVEFLGSFLCEKLVFSNNKWFPQDPNPGELSLMLQPLQGLLDRVQVLLSDWPDHPILEQLISISERILAFSVSSPLIKV